MCWSTNIVERGTPRKAEKDIRVYKVCLCDRLPDGRASLGSVKSYFQVFTYTLRKTYAFSGFGPCNSTERMFGFHSYSHECRFVELESNVSARFGFKYGVVFPGMTYAWQRYGLTLPGQEWEDVRLAECVIPEGALYCVNEFGEYVSDKIRIEEILTYREWKGRHPA